MKLVILGSVVLGLWAAVDQAQQVAPVPFARVVAGSPSKAKIMAGKRHCGDLLRWQVTDPLSPYSGTVLVWLELFSDEARLAVDGESRFDSITRAAADASLLAVASGGMWRGAFDSPWQQRQADGLVVASGVPKTELKAANTGGVTVICGERVDVIPIDRFAAQTRNQSAVMPCKTNAASSALQSNVILVRDGKADQVRDGAPANRLAIGSANGRVVIAGAFNSVGHALTLPQFADFLTAAARTRGMAKFSAMNLDGACAAQLYIPQLDLHFGCDGKNYTANRILVRSAR